MAKFKMRTPPAKPKETLYHRVDIYDGMTLSDVMELCKRFPDPANATLHIEPIDYYSDGVYADVYFSGVIGVDPEVLENYKKELAEYKQWKLENAGAIAAYNQEIKDKELKALEKRKEKIARDLQKIEATMEKLR